MEERKMAKVSLTELARTLAMKHDLSQKEAERFITTFVEVAHHALQYDKQLKVKGLGTFKVIDTKDRQSVNVNTGERIVIEGRGKLSFTADAQMRDLVNKPFAQFETVVMNDGVEFEDLRVEMPEEENPVTEEHVEETSPVLDIAMDQEEPETIEPEVKEPEVKEAETPKAAKTKPVKTKNTTKKAGTKKKTVDKKTPLVDVAPEIEETPVVEEISKVAEVPVVEVDDTSEVEVTPEVKKTTKEDVTPEVVVVPEIVDTQVEEKTSTVPEEPETEETPDVAKAPLVEVAPVTEEPSTAAEEEPEEEKQELVDEYSYYSKPSGAWRTFAWILFALFLIAGGTYLGYYYGSNEGANRQAALEEEFSSLLDTIARKDSLLNALNGESDTLDSYDPNDAEAALKAKLAIKVREDSIARERAKVLLEQERQRTDGGVPAKDAAAKPAPTAAQPQAAKPANAPAPKPAAQAKPATAAPNAAAKPAATAKPAQAPAAKPAAAQAKPATATPNATAAKVAATKPATPVKPATTTTQTTASARTTAQEQSSGPQVKYGAYQIVGLDQVVTVKKGQTLSSISKSYFGPDMESYVEAFNGGVKEVKEGMKLKIPKLELKKKKK